MYELAEHASLNRGIANQEMLDVVLRLQDCPRHTCDTIKRMKIQ